MKKRDVFIGIFVLALTGALLALWLAPEGGRTAPQVEMETLDGSTLHLADLQGQPVLLTFWATTCPSCVEEIPHFNQLKAEYGERGLQVIGVAMHYDPPAQVAEMVRRRNVNYTVALDRDDQVAPAFGNVQLTPTTFLISPRGRIAYQKMGDLDWERVEKHLDRWLPARS
ncbi:redoxin [Ectothiorhodospira haloalkaliphila]|uniref:Redoxin n=1 Tax=Ectothiorhodospira haloalkaliphila TaxID=421628 RepID=W8KF46_9GAMM|nr:TlpA disulfide reductase family protein [Ectothiorhodospira haloalkaliphila]AHK78409.1 redoxin [Ectothiorhodospira haloalkaliphila]